MSQQITTLAIERRPLDWFKTDKRELARHNDLEKIRQRGNDMLINGQLQSVGATEDGRLIFGHGRWLSAMEVGIKMLEVKLFPKSLSETEFRLIGAAENIHRNELTAPQKSQLAVELMVENPTWNQKSLAEHLNLSEGTIVKLLSPSKLSGEWQQAFKDGTVVLRDCYLASTLAAVDQDALLAMKLSGVSRDDLERQVRKVRSGNVPVVRASKIKCQLASGVSVTVSGNEMTLDEMIDSLVEATKETRKARDQGLHAKTFEASMRDRYKPEN